MTNKRLIPQYDPYEDDSIVFTGASRDFLFSGKRKFLDLNGGAYWTAILGNLDHRVMAAVSRGFSIDLFGSYHQPAIELAEILCRRTGYDKLSFGTSGSDAVDTAIRMTYQVQQARGHSNQWPGFITLNNGFHGTTLATLQISGFSRRRQILPSLGMVYAFGNWVTDSTISSLEQANDLLAKEIIASDNQWGAFGGFIFEPIQAVGGMHEMNKFCYQAVAEKCRLHGVIIIADEVTTGMGRTGQFIATSVFEPRPDILILGKALTNGSFPLSATLVTDKIWQMLNLATYHSLDKYLFGTTYAGHPAGCLAAMEVVKRLKASLLERIRLNGDRIKVLLLDFKERHRDIVRDVRGKGLMWGIEFPDFTTCKQVRKMLLSRGIRCGNEGKFLTILPNCYMDAYLIIGKLITVLDEAIKSFHPA